MYIKGNEITISRALVFHSRSHVKVSSRCCCVVSLRSGRDDTRPRPRKKEEENETRKEVPNQLNHQNRVDYRVGARRRVWCDDDDEFVWFFYSNSQQTSFLADIWYFYNSFAWIVRALKLLFCVCFRLIESVDSHKSSISFTSFSFQTKRPFVMPQLG